ncbi:acetyl-CoA carboxylase, carboxyl transferase, beta subunit [Candidatus Magnetoovum chiemensis]|nr:acetyl-CoA carboxylase, carboxyl transferase, beta subunit [Candidatus Magnetoovum chiemensis]
MGWFKKTKDADALKKVKIPEGLWVKCQNCKEIVYKKELDKNLKVCPKCNYHFRLSAKDRLNLTADSETFIELCVHLTSLDPLEFVDTISYTDRLEDSRKKSGLQEAIIIGLAKILKAPVVVGIMDFLFLGGSMGSVVGEKITRAVEASIELNEPFILFTSSGGARMQEGIYSLMQMAKVSAAIARLKEKAIPFITVLTDPTFGGVSASAAMLGDIIIAEPKSLIGFAGARVIQQTISQQLPDNFQQAEFLLKKGLIDMVVHRKDIKSTIFRILKILTRS